jgi:hypothetical protein
MRELIYLFMGFLISVTVSARVVGVLNIETSTSHGELSSVYASDGRIYDVDSNRTKLIHQLQFAMEHDLEVKLDLLPINEKLNILLNKRNEIVRATISARTADRSLVMGKKFSDRTKSITGLADLQNSYVTDFKSEEGVDNLFKTQKKNMRFRSQCYNRAHVWAWELNKKTYAGKKIQTGKMWVFYSRHFIRKYRFKWWFHIAPYVTVNKKVRIIDRTFMKSPVSPDQWLDNLSDIHLRCKEVYKYSSYKDHQDQANCFFIKSSVFYWQPWQIESVETQNQEKAKWVEYEIKKAYRNAFGRFSKIP